MVTPQLIKHYNHKAPTREAALFQLNRFYSENETNSIWDHACRKLNIDFSSEDMDDLNLIYQHLSEQNGNVSVVGRSLLIRLHTYQILEKKQRKNGKQ